MLLIYMYIYINNILYIVSTVTYVEIKCQLDGTDDFYCISYCLLNMFRASNKICNTNHLLHLDGILFPHINDDARSKPHHIHSYMFRCVCIIFSETYPSTLLKL